jgi:DNA-binding XRE family transcriptional regulator
MINFFNPVKKQAAQSQFAPIENLVQAFEADPQRAQALKKARRKLASRIPGDTVQSLRLKTGLSQAAVAKILKNSQSSYSLIESGKRTNVMLSTLEQLAEIFNVSPEAVRLAIKNTAALKKSESV